MHQLFISYSHEDRSFVEKLCYDLEKKGVKYWQDKKEIKVGDSIQRKIREGIDSSQYLCVVISKHSVNSGWVEKEVEIATTYELNKNKKKVLPILLDEIELPWFLEGKLYAPFHRSYDTGISKLLEVIDPQIKDLFIVKNHIETVDLFDPSGKKANIHSEWVIDVKRGFLSEWARCLHLDGSLKNIYTDPYSKIIEEKTGLFYPVRFIFEKSIQAGQELKFKATFEVVNSFLQEKEWWGLSGGRGPCQGCVVNDSIREDEPSIQVIFPNERPFNNFNALIKRGDIQPDSQPRSTSIKGRKAIIWENVRKRENFSEEHMLLWEW